MLNKTQLVRPANNLKSAGLFSLSDQISTLTSPSHNWQSILTSGLPWHTGQCTGCFSVAKAKSQGTSPLPLHSGHFIFVIVIPPSIRTSLMDTHQLFFPALIARSTHHADKQPIKFSVNPSGPSCQWGGIRPYRSN